MEARWITRWARPRSDYAASAYVSSFAFSLNSFYIYSDDSPRILQSPSNLYLPHQKYTLRGLQRSRRTLPRLTRCTCGGAGGIRTLVRQPISSLQRIICMDFSIPFPSLRRLHRCNLEMVHTCCHLAR
jgi:hypothetical protein